MKKRFLLITALVLSIMAVPAVAAEDNRAWAQFSIGIDAWTGEKSVMESRENEWAMFNTSTVLWNKPKTILPPHDNVFKYVKLERAIAIINAYN